MTDDGFELVASFRVEQPDRRQKKVDVSSMVRDFFDKIDNFRDNLEGIRKKKMLIYLIPVCNESIFQKYLEFYRRRL